MTRGLIAVVAILVAAMAGACDSPSQPSSASSSSPSSTNSPASLLDPNGNVVLYVSNQSLELGRVDITVEIDGHPVVSRDFKVGSQHTYVPFRLELARGRHVLTARSVTGKASLRRSFQVGEKGWLMVSYWYYTKAQGSPMPRQLDLRVLHGPWRSV